MRNLDISECMCIFIKKLGVVGYNININKRQMIMLTVKKYQILIKRL